MATRSTIWLISKDGETAKGIYCHFDGYPSNNGKILLENYNTTEKVKDLIEGGDLSVLSNSTDECIYYARDRGEDLRFYETSDPSEYFGEYNYVFDGEKWTVSGYEYNDEILTQNLINENKWEIL